MLNIIMKKRFTPFSCLNTLTKFIDLMISAILAPRFVSIAQVLLSLFVHILQPRCRFVNS